MSYIELENGVVVDDEAGEIIGDADIDDVIKFSVSRRHEAKAQEDAYKQLRMVYDQVIIKHQQDKKLTYGDLVCAVKTVPYSTFDAEGFADSISEIEFTREELMALVLAATKFDRAKLPAVVLDAYDEAVTTQMKKPWVETSVVRKQAPVLRRVKAEEVPA